MLEQIASDWNDIRKFNETEAPNTLARRYTIVWDLDEEAMVKCDQLYQNKV